MARITRATAHLSSEEVKSRLHNDLRAWCRQRWLIIYNALVDPRHPQKRLPSIAACPKRRCKKRISLYNRFGVSAVETAGKGGRRSAYLSLEEEQHFLAPFFARAQTGEIARASEIQRAFETRFGHEAG